MKATDILVAEKQAIAEGTPYLAPRLLVDVDHPMRVMAEESFGPVVGIMKVSSDDEAIALMNDSPYGLTASVRTTDEEAALSIGDRFEPGILTTDIETPRAGSERGVL